MYDKWLKGRRWSSLMGKVLPKPLINQDWKKRIEVLIDFIND